MSLEMIGLLVILLMFLLMFLRVPIAISMAVPAFIGILCVRDWKVLSTAIETIIWEQSFNYTLSTIPMFVLMGEFLFISGISDELFTTFRHWFGRLRGGLAMATIGASAIFSAASGSSLAQTGTMGVIASKEMLKAKYDKALIGGSICAGGTLGNLIPPGTLFIIYGMLTEQSIGQLLIAGILPGILLTLLYILTISVAVKMNPNLAPVGEGSSWKERFLSLRSTGWILLLFIVVIGGMYVGLFSPTEAAGVGAFGAFLIALVRRKLTFQKLVESFSRTLRTTGFLFAIILAAFILNYFLAITRLPMLLANFLAETTLPPIMIFLLIVLMYILLGTVMDSLAMVVVTIPIVLPVILALGFDPIWFGVIIVILMEAAQISPPVGLICFVLHGVAPELGLQNIFKGVLWFMIPLTILILLLILFPDIALYLPSHMS